MTYRLGQYVNNKDPVDQHLHLHLYTPLILICRLVDVLTCRPSVIVNKKDPVRVMVRLGLVLAILALLICRLVDLSTCRPVDLMLLSITKIRLGLGLD